MNHGYEDLIRRQIPLLIAAGVLLAGSIACLLIRSGIPVSDNLRDMMGSGHLSIAMCLSMLIILAASGIFIDLQPGKAITLAVAALPAIGVLYMLLPWALASEWTPVWNGLMIGLAGVVQQIAWRIRARCAVVIVGATLYAALVTAGFAIGITGEVSTATVLGVLASGGAALVMAGLLAFRVREHIRAARRESAHQHLIDTALSLVRPNTAWGAAILAAAGATALIGDGPLRALGLLFAIGAAVSLATALIVPAPLKWAIQDFPQIQEPDRSRRDGRRQRSS